MALPKQIEKLRVQTARLQLRPLPPEKAQIVLDYHLRNRDFFQPWNPKPSKDFYQLDCQAEKLAGDLAEA